MRSVFMSILLALVAPARAKDSLDMLIDKMIDKVVDNLLDRALRALLLDNAKLDNTTLVQPGQLAMPPRTSLSPLFRLCAYSYRGCGDSASPWARYQQAVCKKGLKATPGRWSWASYRPQFQTEATTERHTDTPGHRDDSTSGPVLLSDWARDPCKSAKRVWQENVGAKLDNAKLEVGAKLDNATAESEVLSVGANILWRDLKRNLPLAAREVMPFNLGGALSEAELERATRGKKDFWPAFWFANIFMNTVPWTPLVMPLVLKVVPEKYVIPSQLDINSEPRLARLMAMRNSSKSAELASNKGGQ